MSQLNDISLVTQVVVFRNTRAFDQLVKKYQSPVRRFFLNLTCGDSELSDDLAQDTFIKAYTNLASFKNLSNFSTWLYRIALNECITFLNKQRAMNTVAIDDPEADVIQKLESDPYFSGDRAELLLQKALLTLPEKQRMVFNLKYYQEMKYEEMSEIFGTSVGALKASYHHAVKKIEKFLEGID